MFSLKEKEVNTGRQRELDLVKGFLLIMIVFIHSFQTIGGVAAAESNVHKILFALFMPTGACLYLFTMGFGSAFTRHSQPKDMVKNGIKLLFYQGLSNLCYAAVMTISFNIRNSITVEAAGSRKLYAAYGGAAVHTICKQEREIFFPGQFSDGISDRGHRRLS